ncbi:MAG TPA: hypothetical protein VHO24_00040 [Opitutaceae bacterium]|nr:hypothetical protein [Opitutaceae bacterium]
MPPAPTSAKTVDAEIALPLPPSGDFELTLTAAQISAIVERRYGAFFLSLSLPPDRLVRLRSLLIERQQVTIDAANAALLFGLNPVRDLPVIQRAIQEFQTAVDTKLREEFGDAAFTAYRDFDLTLRERNSVGDFAQRLAATAEPLRPEQEKELLLLLKNSPAEEISRNIDQAIFGGLNERAPITKETIASAARVLSPRQLEIFQTLQQPP